MNWKSAGKVLCRAAREMWITPGLERLAQHFEHAAVPFGQLVEEQHAVMRERNLAGPRVAAAADQRDGARRVMRRAVRAHPPCSRRKPAGERGDRRGGERLFLGQRRQEARQPLREHRLAGAGRADHQQAVRAGCGDGERSLRGLLAAHVGEIGRGRSRASATLGREARAEPATRGRSDAPQTARSDGRRIDRRVAHAHRLGRALPPAARRRGRRGARTAPSAARRGSAATPRPTPARRRTRCAAARCREPGRSPRGCRSRSAGRSGRTPSADRRARD